MASHRALSRQSLRLVPPSPPGPAEEEPSPRPTLDDSEILSAIARGDETAVGALHDRVRPQIDRTVHRLLGRTDRDRDDVAQIALIELVRSLPRFRGECSLDTWVSRITAHAVWKEIRHRRVDAKLFDRSTEAGAIGAPGAVDVERAVTLKDALGRVRKHLDALDPTKAWTVLLHDVCGYDLAEIAEITEASVSAAQTRLVRGRRELHARMAADPELAEVLENRGGAR